MFKSEEWKKKVDFDLMFSIELEEWPDTAQEWKALKRYWPSAEVGRSSIYFANICLLRLSYR